MSNQEAKKVAKQVGKAAGKALAKHELKKKARDIWDKHGDKVQGFVTGSAAVGAGTQEVNWDDLHRPTVDEVPEVFREIHAKAFSTTLEPMRIPADPDEGGFLSGLASIFFG